MAEVLGIAHTLRRELLRGCWWTVGRNLIFVQMAAPDPEIMEGCGIWKPEAYCSMKQKLFEA
jgi:hypothetical protein